MVANLFAGQETVYIAEEEFPWGGKQTTYFTVDGDVIGYGIPGTHSSVRPI